MKAFQHRYIKGFVGLAVALSIAGATYGSFDLLLLSAILAISLFLLRDRSESLTPVRIRTRDIFPKR